MAIEHFQSYREIIPEFSEFQESLRRPLPSHLRVNRLKVKPDILIKRLTEKGIDLITGDSEKAVENRLIACRILPIIGRSLNVDLI